MYWHLAEKERAISQAVSGIANNDFIASCPANSMPCCYEIMDQSVRIYDRRETVRFRTAGVLFCVASRKVWSQQKRKYQISIKAIETIVRSVRHIGLIDRPGIILQSEHIPHLKNRCVIIVPPAGSDLQL